MSSIIICKLCNKQKAPYTCPKCQVPYCGLKCYQSAQHEKCSEQFYEANVLEELQQQSASEDEKRAMLELLKQFEEDCAEDEHEIREGEAAAQLADRLQDVDLDGDPQKIWEKLSKQERDEFQQLVKEQKFTDIVHEWLPWWTYKRAKKPLVSEISPDEPQQQEDLSEYNFPEISTSTKPFSDLCKTGPSDCLRFNTINVMLAYTYMVMRYNGEHHDMCVQCAEDFVSLSQVLLKADNCKSASEAIRNFCASLKLLDDLFISMDYVMEVIENLLMVLHGPDEKFSNDFILMAFSDVIKLIENARKQLKSDPEAVDGRKKLVLMKKKLEYYSSYVLSHSDDHVPGLIPEILTVKEKLLDEMTSHRQTEKKQKKEKERLTAEKKPKIVELS